MSGNTINIPVKETSFELDYNAQLVQDLGVTPVSFQTNPLRDGVYTLNFSVINTLPSYPGFYDVEVSFGEQQLGEIYGWGTRVSTDIVLVCPSPNYLVVDNGFAPPNTNPIPAQGSQNLVLTFIVPGHPYYAGWPIKFSNVSFAFTPQ